jgi:hypothetical protein
LTIESNHEADVKIQSIGAFDQQYQDAFAKRIHLQASSQRQDHRRRHLRDTTMLRPDHAQLGGMHGS